MSTATLTQDRQDQLDAWASRYGQFPNWWYIKLRNHHPSKKIGKKKIGKMHEGILLLLLAITGSRYRKNSTIRRTNESWAKHFGVTPKTIQRWFDVLEECGIVGPGKGNNRRKKQADTRHVNMEIPVDVTLTAEQVEFAIGSDKQAALGFDDDDDPDSDCPF